VKVSNRGEAYLGAVDGEENVFVDKETKFFLLET
jgi:hypothetical protein